MIGCLSLLVYFGSVHANHFNGGTVTWKPVDAYDNSSSVTITIDQSYWWTYPTIVCANNVPITTSGRASQTSNLTCVVDCSTDGGYSTKPIKTLTDCTSASTSLGMLTSQRSQNVTLTAGAHFHLAYVGSAWLGIGKPAVAGLEWSITTAIDLRMRPDGFINTPPVAAIISPQHIFVNRTSEIRIPVSDANVGDDVRCRWATYTSGSRRRRHADEYAYHQSPTVISTTSSMDKEKMVIRHERSLSCATSRCQSKCTYRCPCSCSACLGTTCTGPMCMSFSNCRFGTTTVDTPGTLQSTSTYPIRQAIDECGGICFPATLPSNTILSNCTLSIKSLIPDVWYAAAIQIEDFISTSSSTPMSSVPVQFLIYVMPEPTCDDAPLITPLTGCLEVTVGVPFTFNLTVVNQCDPSAIDMADVIVSKVIAGMQKGNLTKSPSNASQTTVPFTWTPQASQIGEQQMCVVAYTEEEVQSATYCVTFSVIWSAWVCATTTTTTTSTVTSSTTSTTATTVTTTSRTSATSVVTASATAASAATTSSSRGPSWGLIAGISSISLPLALCTFCCLHRLLWSPAAKRRRQEEEELDAWQYNHVSSKSDSTMQASFNKSEDGRIKRPSKSYQIYNVSSEEHNVRSGDSVNENGWSILVTAYNNQNSRSANEEHPINTEESFEIQDIWTQSSTCGRIVPKADAQKADPFKSAATSSISPINQRHQNFTVNRSTSHQDNAKALPTSPSQAPPRSFSQTPGNGTESLGSLESLTWQYLMGSKNKAKAPAV